MMAHHNSKARSKSDKLQIGLTDEQMALVTSILKTDGALIVTRRLWAQLEPQLEMNELAFARRRTASKFDVVSGFDWNEYEWGKHSTKALVQIKCIHCTTVYVGIARKLFARRHKVQVCPQCYVDRYLYDAEWRAKNSASQLIAQNKPETLEKHRKNSRDLWVGEHGNVMREAQLKTVSNPEYQANMSRVMRNKWASDVSYRDKVSGKGVYKHVGVYESVTTYHSKLELAFLLWCEDKGKHVTRCDFSVPYVDPEDNRGHDYYPDFIVDNVIVEVKGQRWIDVSPMTYRAKIAALAKHCDVNGASYRVVLDRDLKAYVKRANAYHETQKQNSCPVQG
jgi:hypothetical protein